ncbi:MAG TPA: DUF2231 domain-containing protein [Gemmatimonadales bacterium]|nr:DUF2231 domain-containing protein [Gemmatimonadales bacterium]
MFGYDWPRLHAALNDLPAALLLVAVLFDLASVILRRPPLRVAGFWTLVIGAIGGVLAVLSGLKAEEHIAHGEAVHELMHTHEELALTTLGIFAVVALWRIVRENRMGGAERGAVLALSVLGTGVLLVTASYGGKLVFDHAAGIPTPVLEAEMHERAEGHHHHGAGEAAEEHEHDEAAPADSANGPAPADSTPSGGHTHPPGTPPHKD